MTKNEVIKELASFYIDESVGMEVREQYVEFYANDRYGNEYNCRAYPANAMRGTNWEACVGRDTLNEDTAQGLFDALNIWAEENTVVNS
jgi:hypothetical protein